MKVSFWTYCCNSGDGSNSIFVFKTKAAAEEYASYDDERNCDDINKMTLEFDADGQLLTPEPVVDEWRLKRGKMEE